MKLKFTYIFFIALMSYIFLKSDSNGRDSAATPLQACASAGCHGSNAAGFTTVDSIVLISKATGLPATQYIAGQSYRIGIYGKYMGNANLHKFGFIVGNGGKGTFSGNSANTSLNTNAGVGYWGHSSPKDSFRRIAAVLTTFYFDTASWTAPATGSGTVTFSGFINAVNNNSTDLGDRPSVTLYNKTFTEYLAGVTVNAVGGAGPFCPGTSKTFNATPTNGGASPTYQWYLNGNPVGTGGTTYTNSTLANNDSVWCIMTSSLSGIGNNPATSNKIKVTVATPYVNNVTIVADKTTVCAGDTATYTATPNAGATGTSYRWYLNAGTIPVFIGNPYTKIGFATGDSISCRLLVANPCATPALDTSNYIHMTVNTSPVITGHVSQTLCDGDSAAATNWQSTMTGTNYSWTNSNPAIGLPASGTEQIGKFLVTNTTANPIIANITVKSFAGGCNGAPVTYTITVRPTPKVRNPTTAQLAPFYCAGSTFNLTLQTIPNFGPTIKWYNSNTATGLADSGTSKTISFITTNSTSDSIYSIVTARATQMGCTGPDSSFTIVVYPRPAVNTVPNLTVCKATPVNSIVLTSPVPSATFSWTNDNTAIGLGASGLGNIPSFTSGNTLNTGTITVNASYKTCLGPSSQFTIKVDTPTNPSVTISTSDSTGCPGYLSKLKATPINGGTAPTYQWYNNGNPISGATKDSLDVTNIQTNQSISCVMTSSSNCVTSSTATSNTINLKISANVTPVIILTTLKDTLCNGDAITINTSVQYGGSSPSYQWYLNGNAISGATSSSYISSSLVMNDKITCEVTSSLTCANPNKSLSNEKVFKVFPIIPTQVSLTSDRTSICSDDYVTFTASYKGQGSNPKVYWTLNGLDMSINPTFITIPITSTTDVVKVEVISSEVCPNPKTMIATISIDTVKQGPIADVFPNKYIAFCEGDSVEVKAFNGQSNYSYLWSNGAANTNFWSKNTMSYTLKITEPGNVCPRYYGPLTTHMNPKPLKPSIASANGYIRSTFADRYQWQLNRMDIFGADSQAYLFPVKGNYRVKVTNSAGCVNYSDDLLAFPLSISSGNMSESITVYPNPTSGVLFLNSKERKIEEVTIYDILGKVVYQDNTFEMNKTIHLEKQIKGNYLMYIKTDRDTYQQKIEIR